MPGNVTEDDVLNRFDKASVSTGFVLEVKLQSTDAEILHALSSCRPIAGRGSVRHNDKKDRFELTNASEPIDQAIEVSIIERRGVFVGFGRKWTQADRDRLDALLFQSLIASFKPNVAVLSYIEREYKLALRCTDNPEARFARLLSGSPLSRMTVAHDVFRCHPDILFAVTSEADTVCKLGFESDIIHSEVKAGGPSEPRTAEVKIGIAKVSGIHDISNLLEAIKSHTGLARSLLVEQFLPNVLEPILASKA